jgi:hypothetical protein
MAKKKKKKPSAMSKLNTRDWKVTNIVFYHYISAATSHSSKYLPTSDFKSFSTFLALVIEGTQKILNPKSLDYLPFYSWNTLTQST